MARVRASYMIHANTDVTVERLTFNLHDVQHVETIAVGPNGDVSRNVRLWRELRSAALSSPMRA